MTFGKKTLFSVLLGIELLATLLEFTHVNFLGISTFLSFFTCILLPGILLSLILHLKKISLGENLLIIVGLSIAFLEFGGLLLNILLPLFGINDPLALQNLIVGFDIYIALLFLIAWIRTKQIVIHIRLPKRSKIEKIGYIVPVFFPILATLGAIVLNNGGSDILTLILLGTIALYSLFLLLLRNRITSDIYPYALFFIGLASLFTTSLRSWYISGHDIEREFYIFQLTNLHHLWNMAFYEDAYNACLSITILPTVLTNLLSIQDMYVYKVVFQILFATSPVLVFFLARNYTTPALAFLAAFLFLSFPTFFNDMAMLNRQEIGFIFFGLVLYMMLKRDRPPQSRSGLGALPAISPDLTTLDTHLLSAVSPDPTTLNTLSLFVTSSDLSLLMRRILLTLFALSCIVSHYSTNFILLALVIFVYLFMRAISLPFLKKVFPAKSRIKSKRTLTNKMVLAFPLVLIIFGMTYFWNVIYTQTSSHTASVISEVISGLFVTSNAKSDDLSYRIFSSSKSNPQQELQTYIQNLLQSEGPTGQLYSQSITDKYPTFPLNQVQLAPTPVGSALTALDIPVFALQAESRSLAADFFQIFVFVGLFVLFFTKNKKVFDLQYLLLCVGSVILLILITLLPALSVEYGILRMFQQLLYLLALPIVLGLHSLFFFVKEQKRVVFTGIIALLLFLNLTGFISHLTGDYYPQMTLDNAGLYYTAYYVSKPDVFAIIWLSEDDTNQDPVEADLSGTNKLLTYGNINALQKIFPALIQKDAYVYLEVSGNTVVSINGDTLIFTSSQSFLDENKNRIYSNGQVNIYK